MERSQDLGNTRKLVSTGILTHMHVDETIQITRVDKHDETIRIPCKNNATSGGSKHKTPVLNCITVLIRVQKLIFEQYPWRSRGSKDGNKFVEDSKNMIVRVIPRAVGNSQIAIFCRRQSP